jgi:peptidase A4-like protein
MKPTRIIIPILAVTAACVLSAVPAASAATAVQQASSGNWSGYVAGGSSASSATRFKSVSGSWVAPTAKCTGSSTYSAYWVGLGGAGQTEALEQAGTEANCNASGQASYYAWYELVPSAPVRVNLGVHAGDHISSRVIVAGTAVNVSVSNQTTGQSFSKQLTMSTPDVTSAEWIAEAPSSCGATTSSCSTLPLTDFGTVRFTASSATTTDGHTGSISDPTWSRAAVSLSPGGGSSGFGDVGLSAAASSGSATPSSLSSDGSSFSVAYSSGGSATSTDAGSGQGYGGGYGYGYPGGGYGDGGYSGGGGYGGGGYGYPGGYGYGGGGGAAYGYGGYVG